MTGSVTPAVAISPSSNRTPAKRATGGNAGAMEMCI